MSRQMASLIIERQGENEGAPEVHLTLMYSYENVVGLRYIAGTDRPVFLFSDGAPFTNTVRQHITAFRSIYGCTDRTKDQLEHRHFEHSLKNTLNGEFRISDPPQVRQHPHGRD